QKNAAKHKKMLTYHPQNANIPPKKGPKMLTYLPQMLTFSTHVSIQNPPRGNPSPAKCPPALRFKPWISANPLPAIVPEHHPHQNPNRDTQYQNEPPTGNPVSAPQNWLILSSSPIYKPEPYEP